MVAAKFAYSFQGVKDILVLMELGKYPGRGVKQSESKTVEINHLINYDYGKSKLVQCKPHVRK